jgi:hypothetical protein
MVLVGQEGQRKKAMEEEVAHLIEAEAVVVLQKMVEAVVVEHLMTVKAVEKKPLVKQIDFPRMTMQQLEHLEHLTEAIKVVDETTMVVIEVAVVQKWKVMEEHLQCWPF